MLIVESIFSWCYFCIMSNLDSRLHGDSCGLLAPDWVSTAPNSVTRAQLPKWEPLRSHCPHLGHLLGENHSLEILKSTEKPKEEKKVPDHFTTFSILMKIHFFCQCNGGFLHFKKTSWFQMEPRGLIEPSEMWRRVGHVADGLQKPWGEGRELLNLTNFPKRQS